MSTKYKKKEPVERIGFAPSYPPSEDQQRIFDHASDQNIHCQAGAGSGKTTTLVWQMSRKTNVKSGMLAFSKEIVTEIEPRCPSNVTVKTAHSFGYGSLAKQFGRLFVNGYKVKNILKENYRWLNPDKAESKEKGKVIQRLYEADRLINMLRVTLTDENDAQAVDRIADRYNIEIDMFFDLVQILPEVFKKIESQTNAIDFTDMMWLPIRLGLEIPQFEQLYVDEAQDLNNLMIEYVRQMASGLVMSVGDRNQSIFGFAGSNFYSVNELINTFDSHELPLMTCYRCGTSIVEYAQRIVPDLKPFEGNPAGEIRNLAKIDMDMADGSMIISRRNASLVKPCFELLKAGRKAQIKGKDIGLGLVNLIRSIKTNCIHDLIVQIKEKNAEKIIKMMEQNKSMSLVEMSQDQCDVICEMASVCSSIEELVNKITMIFSEDRKGITLSSIHRSKGLESDHVSIVDYPRIELSYERMTEEDRQQEKNLHYVAVTRAKNKLDLISQ